MLQILAPEGRITDLEAFRALGLGVADYHKITECMRFTRAFEKAATDNAQFKNHYPLYISPKGQEAIEAASAFLLGEHDWIFWYTRSQAAAFMRGVSVDSMWRVFYGVPEPNAVDDMLAHRVMPPYILVGVHLPHAVGFAWAKKLRGEPGVTVAYFGDGATSRPDFHSGMNFAAVHKIPTVFICENNQWAISTPTELQTATVTFAEKAAAYGVPFERIDGNDIFAVISATQRALSRARTSGGPTLIEAVTYRLDPHTTAVDKIVHVPKVTIDLARDRDPVLRIERFEDSDEASRVFNTQLIGAAQWEPVIKKAAEKVHAILKTHRGEDVIERLAKLNEESVTDALYREPRTFGDDVPDVRPLDAINIAHYDLMEHDRRVIAFGEDVGRSGGAYRAIALPKSLASLAKERLPAYEEKILQRYLPLQAVFGENRAIDTPLDEWGIMGTAIGLALGGLRPIVEVQFSGFVYGMGDHLFSELPEMRQRSSGRLGMPIVIRLPCGAGFFIRNHREFETPAFMNIPGFIIVCPSTPQDAYDLLLAAVASDKPVLFFENKDLYRGRLELEYEHNGSLVEKVVTITSPLKRILPTTPIERFGIRVAREGTDITLLSYGKTLYHCMEAAELLAEEEGIEAEVLDIRVFKPFDRASLLASIRKTGCLVTVGEEPVFSGTMAEFVAEVAESKEGFYHLSAPVVRLGPGNYFHPPHSFTRFYVPQPNQIFDAAKSAVEEKNK